MPLICFSYPADVPPGIGRRSVAPTALRRMPIGSCFSYSAAVPLNIRNRNTTRPGPADHPSPPGGNSGFVSSACASYPVVPCFRY